MSEIAPPARPDRGFRRYLLLGSLCLNVALGGFIGAQFWFLQKQQPLAALAQPGQLVARIANGLPPADAELVRSAYSARESELSAARTDFRAAVARLMVTMARPDITPQALRAAVDEARARRSRQNELLTDMFVDSVGRMSPAARRELVWRFRGALARFNEKTGD